VEDTLLSIEDSVIQLMRICFARVIEKIGGKIIMLKIHD